MEVLIPWRELRRNAGFSLGVLLRRPFQVLLQVTNRCNMKCGMCGFWSSRVSPEEELKIRDFVVLEQQLGAIGRFLISIEGGEPLLRADLSEIVRILSQRHLTVLYSNGWFLDDAMARTLFSKGLAQVGVSIDHHIPENHDRLRGAEGAFEKAWEAVRACRDAAPHAGRQVHVMTVLTDDNLGSIETLLKRTAAMGVGYCITLISRHGALRGSHGTYPSRPVSQWLTDLWKRYPNFRVFRQYLELMDDFVSGASMPSCGAGKQSFNVDCRGNVARCIEKIDRPAGNIRQEHLSWICAQMRQDNDTLKCNDCWSLCRGFSQLLGSNGRFRALRDLATRMRSV